MRALVAALPTCAILTSAQAQTVTPSRYDDLLTLFEQWRDFQRPATVDGVPDYTAAAMATQQRGLAEYQRRLAAFDTMGWTTAQQVDLHVLRAEMNGLDFDHRVLRPWARNPAFYLTVFWNQSDQPAREGHQARGSIELWQYAYPLSTPRAAELRAALRTIPVLLEQARTNLVGDAHDLWVMGIRSLHDQSDGLERLATRVTGNAELVAEVRRAREATDRFGQWLEREAPSKTGPSGVGVEHYDWYLRHVQLVPYTWEEEVTLMRRELARARTALALEEERNRGLPPLAPINDPAEWARRFKAAVSEYQAFLRDRGVLTVRDYMAPALLARQGTYAPEPREFFSEVSYRDPIVMRTHDFHWIDLARMEHDPHPDPIRRGPLLYNVFVSRTEGFATGMEEMMMHAGFLDGHPRGRELIYILIAQRAARALGDLMMHANRMTLEQAARFTMANTPRHWLREDGRTVWFEQHLYLQQPGYGTSYLVGKMQIEQLLADRARQQGDRFTLREFVDEFTAAGLIPVSLIRWEMLGESIGE
ncbi:MAG TPA: DUF885 family protein [Gemmatimonadales bacterium]